MIRRLNKNDSDFDTTFTSLLSNSDEPNESVVNTVQSIIDAVRERGDEAVLEFTNKFDRRVATLDELEISQARLQQALESVSTEIREALEHAAERIRRFHDKQKVETWTYEDDSGMTLGQHVTALERVGVYVPGGKAAYPSSVLMNIIPAKVAGVEEIIMVVPTPDNEFNNIVLAAAKIAGVDRVFSIGGAQAVAALAYGTEQIPKVDKITGPGNIYVATAKRIVFGTVGIDMIAGPSEVLIVSDGKSNPDWVAMDLFAQAEHDEEASAMLISPDEEFLNAVEAGIERLLPEMERKDIIKASLSANGALIKVNLIDEAIELINIIAPEHLELSVEDPDSLLPKIKHAGAIFMGNYSAESLGDYCAGPNHVLPTARTARFSSPLGVHDFQKHSSIIKATGAIKDVAKTASVLARGEGLTAHARSAEYRMQEND